uniref:hypothetical protein n=1 Tax=Italian clover phyllody phytoplasma TaxID=1196420 RepID=UPI0004752F3A
FLITSNNSVMAMTNNKGKQISINEPSDEEVNSFFELLKSSKKHIQKIKQKYPYLKNASSREIEEWALYGVVKQQQNQPKHINKKQKTIDLNTIPEEKE